jgi:hypothetical protein
VAAEKIVHFIAILLTVVSFGPSAAHLFALPNKIGMDQAGYFTVQGIYRGWALFGAVLIPLLGCDIALAIMMRHEGLRFWLAIAASACIALSLVVFFIWVFPGNQATQNWTVAPADWRALRARWEFGHAVNAVIVFASLCALTPAAFLSRGGSRYGP